MEADGKLWSDIVNDTFDLMGINGLTAAPANDETQKVLNMARMLVPFFENKGIYLNAYIPEIIDPTREVNIPDYYYLGFTSQLALKSLTIFGLQPMPALSGLAKEALEGMYDNIPAENYQNPFQPAGQGDRGYYYGPRFMIEFEERNDHVGRHTRRYPF